MVAYDYCQLEVLLRNETGNPQTLVGKLRRNSPIQNAGAVFLSDPGLSIKLSRSPL